MKTCLLCGESVGVDVQTCPKDGEASWSLKQVPVAPQAPVEAPKRGPGRPPKKAS